MSTILKKSIKKTIFCLFSSSLNLHKVMQCPFNVCAFFVSYWCCLFIISDGLFQSTQNRKFLGFQLVRKILPQISARQVPIVFSAHMMRSFINGLSSPKNYLHEAAKQLVCLEDHPSPIFFVPCGTYNCEACTESLHSSQLAATVFQTLLPPLIAILLLPFHFQLCASMWFLVFFFFFFFLVPKSL